MGTETRSLKSYICTQQEEYRKKYPEYDGRGILVAIIDGIVADFSLKGMQKTITRFRKIVDCFDFSSKRLINISTVKKVDSENTIFGLSGLKLKS
uniref:Uncharacterized protein n=1 Tax=Panagrolaimus sp. PS1159 TaxID=55785 RepID=A0AC35F8W4_9BILA